MAGLNSILNIGRSAIGAHQTAVRVASQNVANAQTPGYTRQRVLLQAADPLATSVGSLGSGVRVADIVRLRDELLEAQFRRDSSRAASFDQRREMLLQVEQVFGEPSETGLASAMDALHNAWADLSTQPTSSTLRRVVWQRANQVASMMQGFTVRLDEIRNSAQTRLSGAIEALNTAAHKISGINEQIVQQEAGGRTASDLRDIRDRLLDDMTRFGQVQVVERGNGSIGVLVDGAMLVDGTHVSPLRLDGTPPRLMHGERVLGPDREGSAMAELIHFVSEALPEIEARLDELARGIARQVNELHARGYPHPDRDSNGDLVQGGAFFGPVGDTDPLDVSQISARNLTVVVPYDRIATSSQPDQAGNNTIALAMAALRSGPEANAYAREIFGDPAEYESWRGVLDGLSFSDHYRGLITDVAISTSFAESSAEVFGTLASQADMRRSSVSGVSTDEELVLLMQHQQAYTAAARLINVADEMIQTVLNLGR